MLGAETEVRGLTIYYLVVIYLYIHGLPSFKVHSLIRKFKRPTVRNFFKHTAVTYALTVTNSTQRPTSTPLNSH